MTSAIRIDRANRRSSRGKHSYQPVFDEYERKIRKEYEWVAWPVFCAERAKILRWLASPRVFQTQVFQQRYEAAAQENIRRSLALLESHS